MIQLFKPCFGDEEWYSLREPLRTGWVGLGPKTTEFEQAFAEYIGVQHAIAMNSCTAALHLAMHVAGVADREVITPSLTFISTNHAILYERGVPVFADVEEDTFNVDPGDIERKITPKTRVIVAFHYGGQACQMDEILRIARSHDLVVIEDAAHGCGGLYRGRKLGAIGDIGCFSFQAIKNLSTGEGGMIVTNDDEISERLRRLRWMGITKGAWERSQGGRYCWQYQVEEIGFKYHMHDLTAVIGLVQLRKLDVGNRRRREIAQCYDEGLRDVKWLTLRRTPKEAVSAQHNYVLRVRDRDRLVEHLSAQGIEAGVHYYPNHLYPMYKDFRADVPVTERLWAHLVTLPMHLDLSEDDVQQVIEGVRSFEPEV